MEAGDDIKGAPNSLVGLKTFMSYGEVVTEECFSMCSSLVSLTLNFYCMEYEFSPALFTYMPLLEHLCVTLRYVNQVMRGIRKIKKLKYLDVNSDDCDTSASHLARVPASVERITLASCWKLTNADFVHLKNVRHLTLHDQCDLTPDFLNQLPHLQTLELHGTTVDCYVAALAQFLHRKALCDLIVMEARSDSGASVVETEVWTEAIQAHRGDLRSMLRLCLPVCGNDEYQHVPYLVEALAAHLDVLTIHRDMLVEPATPAVMMPLVWEALSKQWQWSELVWEALDILHCDSQSGKLLASRNAVILMLQQLRRSVERRSWVYTHLIWCIQDKVPHVKEGVGSRDGLLALVKMIGTGDGRHYTRHMRISQLFCAVVTTRAQKELLCELGGLSALISAGYVDDILTLFPLHSAKAFKQFQEQAGFKKLEELNETSVSFQVHYDELTPTLMDQALKLGVVIATR
jgi:hypothetical protein